MSTFDGLVDEFPEIRIDYFRNHPTKRQPAACFLSHVHSDHLLGLDTLKMPFVYCSAVTRRLLLKMEKYPHRINFAKGILEARKQTYRHLKSILRPLPLHTPVDIELGPKRHIRVTLFDANHCPGAVMFLIEGQGRVILYTGDVRAEPWWVNSLVRNPLLIPYTSGQKRLDCMYLDTTFASRHDIHRQFPTKAEGLAELLQKLDGCSPDSVFYFRAWTLGYEDVWLALSSFLRSQVHVDQYQFRLFQATTEDGLSTDLGSALAGFRVGNHEQPGCLTVSSDVKIHSCEPGLPCHSALSNKSNVVWITPIISRMSNGAEIAEVGAGGGRGDLYQSRELEVGSDDVFQVLQPLISALAGTRDTANRLEDLIRTARDQQDHRIVLDSLSDVFNPEMTIEDFVKLMVDNDTSAQRDDHATMPTRRTQSKIIHFPYSRHSSYLELCDLVRAFRPKDICPCTVDIDSWTEKVSIESLFGGLCSSPNFRYDQLIRQEVQRRDRESGTTLDEAVYQPQETQRTETQTASQISHDTFGTTGDRDAAEAMVAVEGQPTQIVVQQKDLVTKIQHAWLDINNGLETRRSRRPAPQPPRGDELVASTSSEDENTVYEQVCSREDSFSDESHDLGDLPDIEDTASRPSGKLRIPDDGEVSNVVDEEGSSTSVSIDIFNVERRREAYRAAKAYLHDGDAIRWAALDIRSLNDRGHQESSPEL